MFDTFQDFKGATKLLFLSMNDKKKMTLSQFREQLATQCTKYNSLAAFQASFEDKPGSMTSKATKANNEFIKRFETNSEFEKQKEIVMISEKENIIKFTNEVVDKFNENRRILIDGNDKLVMQFKTLVENITNKDEIDEITCLFEDNLEIDVNGNDEKIEDIKASLNYIISMKKLISGLESTNKKSVISKEELIKMIRESKETAVEILQSKIEEIRLKDAKNANTISKTSDIIDHTSLMLTALAHDQLAGIDSNAMQAALTHDRAEDGDISKEVQRELDVLLDDKERLSLSEIYDLFMTSNIEVFNNGKNACITKHDDHFTIEYRIEDGSVEDEIHFNKLQSYTTDGNSFTFEAEIEGHIEIKFNRNFYAECPCYLHSFVRVALEYDNSATEDKVFISDANVEHNVRKEVRYLLESNASNYEEYTNEIIDEILQDGSERINTKRIIIEEI